jgi:hypothetical protein
MVSLDLTTLTPEQLTAFAIIDPAAAAAEVTRRSAYPDAPTFLTALAQAALNLETTLASFSRTTQAAKAVLDTNILGIVQQGLVFARLAGIGFTEPTIQAPLEADEPPVTAAASVEGTASDA